MTGIHVVRLASPALDTKEAYVGTCISTSHLIIQQYVRQCCPWRDAGAEKSESNMVLPLRTLQLSIIVSYEAQFKYK